MLTLIAWRNVWRNKSRSAVVMGAMAVGIWALAFSGGFMRSFMISYIRSSILHETSNGQIHHPEFSKDKDIKYMIGDVSAIEDELHKRPEVTAVCSRSMVNGMISSPRQATGVEIVGIEPAVEARVTQLDSLISGGRYLDADDSQNALIGEKLAEKLQVKIRSKVVLTFQDIHGNITAGRFRIAGIIRATSPMLNEQSVFVRYTDLNRLLDIGKGVHEIAYTTLPETNDIALKNELQARFQHLKVEYWGELSPALVFMQEWMGASLKLLIVIIMLALTFGIVNTMMMAVLERIRELGVLMALGMKRRRVFLMIMLETIYLSTVGGPFGLLIGYLTVTWLGKQGLDLSRYSKGLESYGYESILHPSLEPTAYLQIVTGVLITACVASIYPAWKAIQYKPVEAIHTI